MKKSLKSTEKIGAQSIDKPTFKKAISQNAQIIVKQFMFALAKRGAGAKPLQKERCHPEGANTCLWQVAIPTSRLTPPFSFGKPSEMPADRLAPEGSRADRVVPRAARCRYDGVCRKPKNKIIPPKCNHYGRENILRLY